MSAYAASSFFGEFRLSSSFRSSSRNKKFGAETTSKSIGFASSCETQAFFGSPNCSGSANISSSGEEIPPSPSINKSMSTSSIAGITVSVFEGGADSAAIKLSKKAPSAFAAAFTGSIFPSNKSSLVALSSPMRISPNASIFSSSGISSSHALKSAVSAVSRSEFLCAFSSLRFSAAAFSSDPFFSRDCAPLSFSKNASSVSVAAFTISVFVSKNPSASILSLPSDISVGFSSGVFSGAALYGVRTAPLRKISSSILRISFESCKALVSDASFLTLSAPMISSQLLSISAFVSSECRFARFPRLSLIASETSFFRDAIF